MDAAPPHLAATLADLADARVWAAGFAVLADEGIDAGVAGGRVLADAIVARADLPPRPQAAWGGYAVASAATEGASDYNPLLLHAQEVAAGDALPGGADAVIPWAAAGIEGGLVPVLQPVAAGTGTEAAGSVVRAGAAALPAGCVVRGPALMLLRLLGVGRVRVRRQPRVGLMVSDAMVPLLQDAVARTGALADALPGSDGVHWARAGQYDAVLTTAEPGVAWALRGVAIHPGGDAALGAIGPVPVMLLPLLPLHALAAFELLGAPLLRRLGGHPEPAPRAAVLEGKISSPIGVAELVRVRLEAGRARPVRGAGLLQAVQADGWVLVPADREGWQAGTRVDVHG